ncbi:MAG: gamma-glutamyl-phosphate reductase, partial [archaeon]|nr:gamma-glutamyl-phosphate reductase [archaeon]
EYAKALDGKVKLRADSTAYSVLKKKGFSVEKAEEKDWKTEYNDLILSVKTVKNLGEAINHINKYGSKHTDGILTENKKNAERFLREVDSSSVVWNASTRFADGFRYGKGAEIGIATGKIHTRGPSGAEALLTYKYVLKGNGNIVADYSGKNPKKFLHKKIRGFS